MTLASIALAGLRARRARIAFSALTLALSLATLTFTLSVTERIRGTLNGFDRPRLALISALRGGLPLSYVARAERVLQREHSAQYVQLQGGDDRHDFHYWLFSMSDDFFDDWSPVIARVDAAEKQRWLTDRTAVLATESVLAGMHWRVGDAVTLHTEDGDVQANVAGTIHGGIEPTVAGHFAYLDAHAQASDRGQLYIITVPCDRADFAETEAKLDAEFAGDPQPVLTIPWQSLNEYYLRGTAALPDLLQIVAWIMALVALLIHCAALTSSLIERRAEMATLRVIGFSKTRISMLIILESVFTTALGGVIGCILPLLVLGGRAISIDLIGLDSLTLSYAACAIGLSVSVIAGLCAAFVPMFVVFRAPILSSLTAS